MADEKNDIDEWLDDTDGNDELDQLDIDALLSSEESKGDTESDDSSAEGGDELDQSNIDALFDFDDDDDSLVEEAPELDQTNIDALLGGLDEEDGGEEDSPELDQDNIDELFAEEKSPDEDKVAEDDNQEKEVAEESDVRPETADDSDENIEALFDDIDAASADPGKDDDASLDDLFSDEDNEAEETQLSTEEAEELAQSAFGSDVDEMDELFSELEQEDEPEEDPFESEEIDFAQMLSEDDADDEDDFLELAESGSEDEEDDVRETAPEAADDAEEKTAGLTDLLNESEGEEKEKGGFLPAAISDMSRTMMASIGGGLIALLLVVGFFFSRGGGEENSGPAPATPPRAAAQQVAQVTPQAALPEVEDAAYSMSPKGGEVAVNLPGSQEDGLELAYTITQKPRHGRLSGTAPQLTYLPNQDFPGEDRFAFTVSDGERVSPETTITITGPNLYAQAQAQEQKLARAAQQKAARKKVIKPRKPKVLAKDVTFYTVSTAPVIIDWQRIWQEANKSAFSPETHVKIIAKNGLGRLERIDHNRQSFIPDPYNAGTETITYRFKKGGFRSVAKTITIDVELGDPAPEVNFARLEDGYVVGQKVVLDASPSRDEQRDGLTFRWQQTHGVPVEITPLNKEGSKIAFVMPSSFYTARNSGPSFRVYARDRSGKVSSSEITVHAISRRQTALWRGSPHSDSLVEEPEMRGSNFPWPFND